MSALRACEVCQGRKVLLGMGGIKSDCPKCLGVGWRKEFTTEWPKDAESVEPKRRDIESTISVPNVVKRPKKRDLSVTYPESGVSLDDIDLESIDIDAYVRTKKRERKK